MRHWPNDHTRRPSDVPPCSPSQGRSRASSVTSCCSLVASNAALLSSDAQPSVALQELDSSSYLPTPAISLPSQPELGVKAVPIHFPADAALYKPLWPGGRLRQILDSEGLPKLALSVASTRRYQAYLSQRLAHDVSKAQCGLLNALAQHNIPWPRTATSLSTAQSHAPLDLARVKAMSSLATAAGLSLPALIRLYRGETAHDSRPNKAMCPKRLRTLFAGYPFVTQICQIADTGYIPPMKLIPARQLVVPPNHKSAVDNPAVLHHLIRSGQDAGQYLCLFANSVDSETPFFSPVGLVPKKDQPLSATARLIHDLSWPQGASINAWTHKEALPATPWHRVADLAKRITFLLASRSDGVAIRGMVGDVKAAYRNLRVHADFAHLFGLPLLDSQVVAFDLSAPFGWTGSPAIYCMFGNAIAELVAAESPQSLDPDQWHDTARFWRFVWMDDHALIELDTPGRLVAAECALRLAMLATFGPDACAEDKFSAWQPILRCVGLDFDLDRGLVSMPASKLSKARSRVDQAIRQAAVSRLELSQLLGSLRHICSCIPAGRAFYQHLQVTLRRTYRFGRQRLSRADFDDLLWFRAILSYGRLHAIPTSLFVVQDAPSIFLYMDASDLGLCVLDLGSKRYILLQWDALELSWIKRLNDANSGIRSAPPRRTRGKRSRLESSDESHSDIDFHLFSIDVREHLSGALAVLVWGSSLGAASSVTHTHIRFMGDNTTSVSWTNKLASSNLLGRNINRALAIAQAQHNLHISEAHLPGCRNVMADHGSRLSDPVHRNAWLRLSQGWTETPVPDDLRYLYRKTWSRPQSGLPSTLPQPAGTKRRSGSSSPIKSPMDALPGSLKPALYTPHSWWHGLWPSTMATGDAVVARQPSDLASAQSAGVIGPFVVSPSL